MNIQVLLDTLIEATDDLSNETVYNICDNKIFHRDGVHNCYECVFYKGWNEGCMLTKISALAHEVKTIYDETIKNN